MNIEEAKNRIKKLTEEINYHNKLYYTDDNPEIEDYEYDKLFRELENLERDFPNLKEENSPTNKVGGMILEKFEKFEHPIAMYSLSNVMNEEEFFDFDNRMKKEINSKDIKYTVENKFDGLALELIYQNGKLIVASTRGDGQVGENVTNNVKVMNNVPKNIKEKNKLIIRGEALITKKDFEALNREREELEEVPFANPRNAASGGLRQLDSSESKKRRLKFFAYQIANYKDLLKNISYTFLEGESKDFVYKYSDALIMSSGTASLISACYGKPMVICYRISYITFFLGKILTNIKYIGMPNVMLNEEAAPELLQSDCNPNAITSHIIKYLTDKEYYKKVSDNLIRVRDMLGEKNVLERAAKEIINS